MGKIFTLDSATKSIIQDALDDLITELGKKCRLFYPPKWVECVNCTSAAVGQKSVTYYKTGGPIVFPAGAICPMCDGSGGKQEEVSELMTLSCAWNPKDFWYPIPAVDVRTPYSILQTKGYLKDLPKVVRASYLMFQTNIEGLVKAKFHLVSMPGDVSNIIQGRYFVCMWEQRGD